MSYPRPTTPAILLLIGSNGPTRHVQLTRAQTEEVRDVVAEDERHEVATVDKPRSLEDLLGLESTLCRV